MAKKRVAAIVKIQIPAGQATLGLQRCHTDSFGWDNEYEEHTIAVPSFSIDQYEVTNREYLQFMNDAGYKNQALWNVLCHDPVYRLPWRTEEERLTLEQEMSAALEAWRDRQGRRVRK